MLYQGGLGLLDKDYYVDEDKADKREAYVQYIGRVFALLGAAGVTEYTTEEAQKKAANQVLELETALADAHLTRTACRDPELTYNKRTLVELQAMCAAAAAKRHQELQISSRPGVTWAEYLSKPPSALTPPPSSEALNQVFNWEEYFQLIGKEKAQLGDINVATVRGIEKMFELLCFWDGPGLQDYLVFQTVRSFSDCHLPIAFKEAHFDFYESTLKGTTEMKPRWKTVLAHMEVMFVCSVLFCLSCCGVNTWDACLCYMCLFEDAILV